MIGDGATPMPVVRSVPRLDGNTPAADTFVPHETIDGFLSR